VIYILARDLKDAQQWCAFHHVRPNETYYVGARVVFRGRHMTTRDRIVRTALAESHPDARGIAAALEVRLLLLRFTETVHGNLVEQTA
jgi:hypothetical protein